MNVLNVKWKDTRYHQNGWIAGSVLIEEIVMKDKNFDDKNQFPYKTNMLAKVSGNINFSPMFESNYTLYAEFENDAKWGKQLKILSMNEKIQLETLDDKKMFLQQILTPLQVEELYSKYDNPFQLLNDENIPALMEVKGIGEIMANKLIQRFKGTIDNAPAFIFFGKIGLTSNMINKLINTYYNAQNAVDKFKENPYILVEDIDGVGFIKADEIALKYGIDKHDKSRIKAGIIYFLKNNAENEGSTYINPTKFRTGIVLLLGIDFKLIHEVFNELVENEEIYANKENQQIALMKNYNIEKSISDYLKMFINSKSFIEDKDDIYIEEQIKAKEQEQGFEFTDEQKSGIYKVLKNNVCVITGGAGTGKTSVVNGFISTLPNNCSIAQTAFSAQAAKRMTEATGYPSLTIHRLLGYIPGQGFKYDEVNKLGYDVVILDECSMVPIDLFWFLIRAIRPGAKLIILGDHRQLPPIGIGNLFTDLLNSPIIPKQILTKIHRQAAKSAIITNSIKIRNMEQIVSPNMNNEEIRGELQDFIIGSYQDKDKIINNVIDAFKKEWNDSRNIKALQIIVAMKERGNLSQRILNEKIQEIVNPKGGYKKEISISKDTIVRVGDKVINRKNNYNVFTTKYEPTQVFNGSIGIVKDITNDYMIIDFVDIGELIIKQDMYSGIQLAYAITCHSSQGSQWPITFTVFDNAAYILLSSEWIYTAMTRAKKKCYMYTETGCLRDATKRTSIKNRDTFLKQFLEEEV